jgi:nucleoside-diphosphate-sugar epimerase
MECLLRIIDNDNGVASRRIFNIGNPGNCASVKELATMMIEVAAEFPQLRERAQTARIENVTSADYYGKYYQDIQLRVPAIEAAREALGWTPSTDLREAVRQTIAYYVKLEGTQRRASSPFVTAA